MADCQRFLSLQVENRTFVMLIEQFYDKGLAHGSYGIISNGKMAVIDPGRDPQPYLEFARLNDADIVAIIETHPHADFVSSHLELHQRTGGTIYVSKLVGANYPHQPFDEGDEISLGDISLKAINTPGHSPDSICVLLTDEKGEQRAIFTGDTLFVGDVGRPDLREEVGNITAKKEELAKAMYRSTRDKLMHLPEEVLVYPAHGPGSLCGKTTSPDLYSTIGRELRENYALQLMNEPEFVQALTSDQPFVPKYFGYNVSLNKQGAPGFADSLAGVRRFEEGAALPADAVVVDTRPQVKFKAGHLPQAINLQDALKFETWLGSVIAPGEKFYLVADNEEALQIVLAKTAKIGYEQQIIAAGINPTGMTSTTPAFDPEAFNAHREKYTIVDIRNENEFRNNQIFEGALEIPLPELRERAAEIPGDKPVVIHCAGGYRSAAGASIVQQVLPDLPVLDMSDHINLFNKH